MPAKTKLVILGIICFQYLQAAPPKLKSYCRPPENTRLCVKIRRKCPRFGKCRNIELAFLKFELHNVPDGVFHEMNALKKLLIAGTDITEVPQPLPKSLKRLELFENKITTLVTGQFDGLVFLRQLKLRGNQLKIVSAGVFDQLKNLRRLNLAQNQIETLPSYLFRYLPKLSILDLHQNNLTTFDYDMFDQLKNLTVLDLSHNQIRWIHQDTFKNLGMLRRLNLANNHLDDLPAGIFEATVSLKFLEIHHNKLNCDELMPGYWKDSCESELEERLALAFKPLIDRRIYPDV